MFSGIITNIGKVKQILKKKNNCQLEIVSKIIIILSRFIIFSFTKNYSYYTINIEFDAIYIFGEILWME